MRHCRDNDIFARSALTPALVAQAAFLFLCIAGQGPGHVYIPKHTRAGGYPAGQGGGWFGEAYLSLPDSAVQSTISAENYVATVEPDFTFRTDWIDFPAGPTGIVPDKQLVTVRDLLDDHIYDVSNPAMLDEPMSHLVLRFTGLVKVVLEDEVRVRTIYGMPIWVEFGSLGYDGFLIRVGDQICYERPDSNFADPWFNFGPSIQAQGLFPTEVLYFNRYDPGNTMNAPNGGFELYSWHGGGLVLPGGLNMVHAIRGQGTLVPPEVIYQPGDELPVPAGDFDADIDVDLRDFQWFQNCYFPPDGFIILPDGCETFDFAPDNDVDADDLSDFLGFLSDPE